MDEQPKIPTPAPVLLRELNYTYTPIVAFVIVAIIALVLWISMIYHEKAEEPGAERWLILGLYLIGLSMGAHQMTMLAEVELTPEPAAEVREQALGHAGLA